jgi:hypothetical protein
MDEDGARKMGCPLFLLRFMSNFLIPSDKKQREIP